MSPATPSPEFRKDLVQSLISGLLYSVPLQYVIAGPRHIGKSTLLDMLAREIETGHGEKLKVVRCGLIGTTDWIGRIFSAIAKEVGLEERAENQWDDDGLRQALVAKVAEGARERPRLVVILDEADRMIQQITYADSLWLIELMRSLSFVTATNQVELKGDWTTLMGRFLEPTQPLGLLSRADAELLLASLVAPAGPEAQEPAKALLPWAGCHPFLLKVAALNTFVVGTKAQQTAYRTNPELLLSHPQVLRFMEYCWSQADAGGEAVEQALTPGQDLLVRLAYGLPVDGQADRAELTRLIWYALVEELPGENGAESAYRLFSDLFEQYIRRMVSRPAGAGPLLKVQDRGKGVDARLLGLFQEYPGRTFTKAELLEAGWPGEEHASENAQQRLTATIGRLRDKLKETDYALHVVRGIGWHYRKH